MAGHESVWLFREVELDVDTSAGGAVLTIKTELPTENLEVKRTYSFNTETTTTGRKTVRVRLAGSTKGHLIQARIAPTGTMTLFGVKVFAKRLGGRDGWAWYPLPVVATPHEWTRVPLPIEPTPAAWRDVSLPIAGTPNEWTDVPLPIAATPDEWRDVALPIEATPDTWSRVPLPIAGTPDEWSRAALPIPASPDVAQWFDIRTEDE